MVIIGGCCITHCFESHGPKSWVQAGLEGTWCHRVDSAIATASDSTRCSDKEEASGLAGDPPSGKRKRQS